VTKTDKGGGGGGGEGKMGPKNVGQPDGPTGGGQVQCEGVYKLQA